MPSRQKEIGRRVREARTRLELTQDDLAERLDLEEATIRAIETGRRGLSVDSLVRMADALGVEVGDLLRDPADHRTPVQSGRSAEAAKIVSELTEDWQMTAVRILREIRDRVGTRRVRVTVRHES